MKSSDSNILNFLLLICIIVYFIIITAAKVILALLILLGICGIIAGIIWVVKIIYDYHKGKKKRKEDIALFEQEMKQLDEEIQNCNNHTKSEKYAIFYKSYQEILSLTFEIKKTKAQLEFDRLSKKKRQENAQYLISLMDKLKQHKKIDNEERTAQQTIIFQSLSEFLKKTETGCTVWIFDNKYFSNKSDYDGSTVKREIVTFKERYFNDVHPRGDLKVYSFTANGYDYYVYPNYFIEAKSGIDFTIHEWHNLNISLIDIIVVEQKLRFKGSIVHGYTDYNPFMTHIRYPKYKYGVIKFSDFKGLNLVFANYYFGERIHNYIKKLSDLNTKKDQDQALTLSLYQNDSSLTENYGLKLSVISKYNVIISAMKEIINKNGKDVICKKMFINILEDNHIFDDETIYVRNILKIIQNEGYSNRILKEKGWTIKCKTMHVGLAQKYMMKEQAVQEVFMILASALGWYK